MEQFNTLSDQASDLREKFQNIRILMEEGTSKLDAVIKIIRSLKLKEESVLSTGSEPKEARLVSEEQIDGLLEMLKTPAFQHIAKQVLIKWLDKS